MGKRQWMDSRCCCYIYNFFFLQFAIQNFNKSEPTGVELIYYWSAVSITRNLHRNFIRFCLFFLSLSLSLGSLFKIEITYPNCNANQMKSWLVLFSYHFLFHCLLFETYRTASTNSEDVLVFFVAII